jgi:hypothetical protein
VWPHWHLIATLGHIFFVVFFGFIVVFFGFIVVFIFVVFIFGFFVVFFGFWPQEGGPAVTPWDFVSFALLEERWQPPSDQREK